MSRPSLFWIDWKLARRSLLRESAWRLLFLGALGGYLAVMLLSGGVARFLSGQWAMTAVLRQSVTEEEGKGIAGQVASLPAVASAVYRSPEAAWKEFLGAFPGMEPLRTAGGNPLPGYVEIRLRPGGFTEGGIASVESALNPLPQVDKVLAGGIWMHRLLRAARWANAALWALFGVLAVAVAALFAAQERSRAVTLSGRFAFLAERGVPPGRLRRARAGAAAVSAGLAAAVALVAAGAAYRLAESRFPPLRAIVGGAEELLAPERLICLLLFPSAAALVAGAASLLGWSKACGSRR